MARLQFVSYDGDYPNLCSGVLTVKVDGKTVVFPKHFLSSGGGVYFTNNYADEHVEDGEWGYDEGKLPADFPVELAGELLSLINDNIPHGCCGGCI